MTEFTNEDIRKLYDLASDAKLELFIEGTPAYELWAHIVELHDRIAGEPRPMTPEEERAAFERWGRARTPTTRRTAFAVTQVGREPDVYEFACIAPGENEIDT